MKRYDPKNDREIEGPSCLSADSLPEAYESMGFAWRELLRAVGVRPSSVGPAFKAGIAAYVAAILIVSAIVSVVPS